jgi:putative IMPACT (imprinted ancient) family translation regulator
MADCCKTGFMWDGTPNGSEGKLASNDVYITGTEKKAAVMVIHDVFGWKLPNTRLLADQYAESIGATVYVPDL